MTTKRGGRVELSFSTETRPNQQIEELKGEVLARMAYHLEIALMVRARKLAQSSAPFAAIFVGHWRHAANGTIEMDLADFEGQTAGDIARALRQVTREDGAQTLADVARLVWIRQDGRVVPEVAAALLRTATQTV